MAPLACLDTAPWQLAKALYLIDISWALAYGSFPHLGHLAYGSWPIGYLGDMIELTKAYYFQELKTIFVIGFLQIWYELLVDDVITGFYGWFGSF